MSFKQREFQFSHLILKYILKKLGNTKNIFFLIWKIMGSSLKAAELKISLHRHLAAVK